MLYEPWVETAKKYNELISNLKQRGYSNISMSANPLLKLKAYCEAPVADVKFCKITKTMIGKKNL